jgi:hypothetical protein
MFARKRGSEHSDLLQTNDWKSHEIFSALATEQHSLTLVALSPIGW